MRKDNFTHLIAFIALFCAIVFLPSCHSEQAGVAKLESDGLGFIIPGSLVAEEPFIIDESGCYRLSGNRVCEGTGIIINTDNVTVDLMGYQLTGPGKNSGENYGVLTNNYRNLEIRNGTIRNFGDRGIVDKGRKQQTGYKRIINIRAISNGECGVCIGGPGNLVRDCTFAENGVTGVCPGYRCIVINNICHKNKQHGIHPGRGSLITQNVVSENGQSGILAFCGSTVIDNTVYSNNTSSDPNNAGIRVMNGCLIKGNTLRDNRVNNIYVEGLDNSIEGNLLTQRRSAG